MSQSGAGINVWFFCWQLVTFCCLITGCGQSRAPAPVKSPDGKLTLITSVNTSQANPLTYLCIQFEIKDAQGKVLHREQTSASDRMRWSMVWEGNNRVVLSSADTGTYKWQRQASGKWQKLDKSGVAQG